jgi:hypothetical protein
MSRHSSIRNDQTSLDLLESENILLRDLFHQIDERRGSSVGDRYKYGNLAKQVIRHLAIRQSSLMNVAVAISPFLALRSISDRMRDTGIDRRHAYDDIGDMARDVPVMSLNQGQDFDGTLTTLIDAVTTEMDWELTEAIPLIRRSISLEDSASLFSSARYVQRHAPTKLNQRGPRWYEHVPVVSRVVTVFDHLNDYLARDHYKRRS